MASGLAASAVGSALRTQPRRSPRLNPAVRRTHRRHGRCQSVMGRPAHPGRAPEASDPDLRRTVSRLLAKRSRAPSQPWRKFLANHLSALVSMDFFTVSTLTGSVLFVLVLLRARPPPSRPRRRHRAPHRRVDRPAAGRRLPRGPPLPDSCCEIETASATPGGSADRRPRHHQGGVECRAARRRTHTWSA